jgi:hypothetical protein
MHDCEFCLTEYVPRSQVKNPRACPACQKERQKENEKSWKQKNLGLYDGRYHRLQREGRKRQILTQINQLVQCIELGCTLLGTAFSEKSPADFKDWLMSAILTLGVRRANKFWGLGIMRPIKAL